jgi:hypothetical protein
MPLMELGNHWTKLWNAVSSRQRDLSQLNLRFMLKVCLGDGKACAQRWEGTSIPYPEVQQVLENLWMVPSGWVDADLVAAAEAQYFGDGGTWILDSWSYTRCPITPMLKEIVPVDGSAELVNTMWHWHKQSPRSSNWQGKSKKKLKG